MRDLILASDFFNFIPSVDKTFKRPITVKLPLPDFENEEFPQEDLAIMHMTPEGWQVSEAPLKFTKSAVGFETNRLTR